MASIFRGPLYSAGPRARGRELGWTQNLLESTLGGAPPGTPFTPEDWPNPIRRRQTGEITLAGNLLLTVLSVAVAAPFNQVDWPNPAGRITRQEAGTTQSLLQTTLGAQPRPFSQFDWTTPALKRGVGQTNDPPNLIGTVLAVPQGTPFAQEDWPNPAGRIRRQEAGITQSLLQTTLGAQPRPFSQFDWQAESGRKSQGYENPQNLLATTLAPVAQAPFAQFDWTTPARKGGVGKTNDPPNLIGSVLATPQGTPFAQVDWPNPLLRIPQHDSAFSQDRLATTLFTLPAGEPFSSNDWPNPLPWPAKQQGTQERNRIVLEVPQGVGRLIAEIKSYAALSGILDLRGPEGSLELRGPGATTRIN